MTAQIPDRILLDGKKYDIVGVDGGGLFNPASLGLLPTMMHTACYRGFYCLYTIEDGKLHLSELVIRTKEAQYKEIDGIQPEVDPELRLARYTELNLPMAFSGRLRIAREFMRDFYIHMGFQKPSAYRMVIDLEWEAGALKRIVDRSSEYAMKRGSFKEKYQQEDITRGIEDAFSLDLDAD